MKLNPIVGGTAHVDSMQDPDTLQTSRSQPSRQVHLHVARHLLFALGLAALSASSFAADAVYTSSSSFLANVAPGHYTESFDGLPPTPPSSFTGSGFSYSISAASGLFGSGTFLGTDIGNEAMTMDLSGSGVTAIGANFFATDFFGTFKSTSLTLTLSDGTTVTFAPTSAADSYRGFTSTQAISSLTISAPGDSLYAGVDNLTVGVAASAVPEPAAWSLMGLGLVALLVTRRRNA